MIPKIIEIKQKRLIGMRLEMNLIDNKTVDLWQQFSPRIKEIRHKCFTSRYSLQIYPEAYFDHFDPSTKFIKWAAVEVSSVDNVPSGMQVLTLKAALYAVFHHKGSSANPSVFQYIYGQWIPNSDYALDNRPHFEVLPKNYRPNDPNSEEDLFIPIRTKSKLEQSK
jgi:AraC family transcriptional regulator